MSFDTPVLFLIFNRPQTAERVFERIRQVQPKKLYIAADGPRSTRPEEPALCAETRGKVLSNIDWDCEVHTLFRDANLGCKEAVSSGITWFFQQEEEGIILEDDTLPDLSFFRFCEELLDRYRNDNQVMSISGSNLLGTYEIPTSYFWGQGGIWGWASWRRAWSLYDKEMVDWPSQETKEDLWRALGSKKWFDFYEGLWEATYKGKLDTWDVQWLYSVLVHSGYTANPKVNLVENIGFGKGATHTASSNNYVASLKSHSLAFPLVHPLEKKLDLEFLGKMYEVISFTPFSTRVSSLVNLYKSALKQKLRKLFA